MAVDNGVDRHESDVVPVFSVLRTGIAEAHDEKQLEKLHEHLLDEFPDVLALLPSFIAAEDALSAESAGLQPETES